MASTGWLSAERTDALSDTSSGTISVRSLAVGLSQVSPGSPPGRQPAETSCPSSANCATRCRPTDPSAPVTRILTSRGPSSAGAEALEISVDHHGDQLLEIHPRCPAQILFGFGWVSQKKIDLGRPHEPGIRHHMLLPVEAHMTERGLYQLPYTVGATGADHVVLR